jgi:hypothetical protein
MSGECDKCGEHCLECTCGISVWAAAAEYVRIRRRPAAQIAAMWERARSGFSKTATTAFVGSMATQVLSEQDAYLASSAYHHPVRWAPIETAPKDGSRIMLYCPIEAAIINGQWREYPTHSSWIADDWNYSVHPTHWMPLPAPPQSEGAAA